MTLEGAAERAGVGAAWYGWLEAGRNIALSHAALGWVADALELGPSPRRRLIALANLESAPALVRARAEIVPKGVRDLLDGFASSPAYVIGARGDILAWNDASEALYRCSTILPARRNALFFLFTQPEVRRLVVNWSEQARFVARALYDRVRAKPKDRWLSEPYEVLARASAEFRSVWRSVATAPREPTLAKVFQKSAFGRLTFQYEELVPAGASDLRVAVYLPAPDGPTRKRLEAIVVRHRGSGRAQKKREGRYRLVRRVKEHLDDTYARDVPASEIAGLLGVDRFLLTRVFAEEVGFPPHAYRLLVRIERAKRRLLDGEPAARVAEAVGFVDQSHLIRHFRRIEGMTPREFVEYARR